jgi:mannobiose 2-epimerase
VGGDGQERPEAAVSTVLMSRVLWTLASASSVPRWDTPERRALARSVARKFQTRFWDEAHGGFYWIVAPDGGTEASHKHLYAQAFAIYALARHHRTDGDRDSLARALALYTQIEDRSADPVHGGYREAFAADWTPAAPGRSTPVSHGAPKTMNTHLHLLEAYAELYRASADAMMAERLGGLFDLVVRRIVDPEGRRLRLFFTDGWDPTSAVISYGHDIEASWLLLDAAESLGDRDRVAAARRLGPRMAEAALTALDVDGGLMNEGNPEGITDRSKHWWPQAEALVGAVNAYQITGDLHYLRQAQNVWGFIRERLIDPAGGEWWEATDPGGNPITGRPKVSAWKCPYHNFRAMMEVSGRLGGDDRESAPSG